MRVWARNLVIGLTTVLLVPACAPPPQAASVVLATRCTWASGVCARSSPDPALVRGYEENDLRGGAAAD